MKVQRRRVNVKRHTLGYKVSGKWYTRNQTAQLAQAGRIDGVTVCRGEYGNYIQSLPSAGFTLENLPETDVVMS